MEELVGRDMFVLLEVICEEVFEWKILFIFYDRRWFVLLFIVEVGCRGFLVELL